MSTPTDAERTPGSERADAERIANLRQSNDELRTKLMDALSRLRITSSDSAEAKERLAAAQASAAEATARAEKAEQEQGKLAAFKAYVHKRLDDAGVPVDPESTHKAEGCRIGGRLDLVLERLARFGWERDEANAQRREIARRMGCLEPDEYGHPACRPPCIACAAMATAAPQPTEAPATGKETPPNQQHDDPEADATDFAHPAWWRGHDHTAAVFCAMVNDILDGKDDGEGVNVEPWASTRKRLLATAALRTPPADGSDPGGGETLANREMNECPLCHRRTLLWDDGYQRFVCRSHDCTYSAPSAPTAPQAEPPSPASALPAGAAGETGAGR